MHVIFLFPLVFSLFAALLFVVGDYGMFTKLFFTALVIATVVMQFTPLLRESVHFLVPLGLQLFVGVSWYFASQFE
ncbi:MAG: hypothetical protein AB7U20_02020 [Planctomycetaceae bacterium]